MSCCEQGYIQDTHLRPHGAVWCPADDARYTAIEPPLDLIKCVTTEDTTRDGLDHPPEPWMQTTPCNSNERANLSRKRLSLPTSSAQTSWPVCTPTKFVGTFWDTLAPPSNSQVPKLTHASVPTPWPLQHELRRRPPIQTTQHPYRGSLGLVVYVTGLCFRTKRGAQWF